VFYKINRLTKGNEQFATQEEYYPVDLGLLNIFRLLRTGIYTWSIIICCRFRFPFSIKEVILGNFLMICENE
jgi:hypothetical protein